MTEYLATDYAWAAGFFDGEGNIDIARVQTCRQTFSLVVTVTQTRPEPLTRLSEMFGGSVKLQNDKWKDRRASPLWRWRVCSGSAGAALRAMRPYLVVKAEEADVAIRFDARRDRLHRRHRTEAQIGVDLEDMARLRLIRRTLKCA